MLVSLPLVAQAPPISQEPVKKGAYLALAGDCIACHTAGKGLPFAGGAAINTPIGAVFSTNITPDPETGIGRYTVDEFVKVMREGVAKDGHHLYPAMPYTSYARLSREDLVALYAYFMQGVAPVHNPNRPTKLRWPLSVRPLMAIWNALYLHKGENAADPNQGEAWNRGAYLVQGLGHCGDCHTPRGLAGQVKAASEKEGRHFLAGTRMDNWQASPLSGDPGTGLQAWSTDEIVEFLKTGRTARVAAFGIMAGVVGKSTQYLTGQDLLAIAVYLKSLPPSSARNSSGREMGTASAATRALRAGDAGPRGSRIYLDNCNACHRSDGTGASRVFPNLANNEVVNAEDPISLIHIVLAGAAMPSTQSAPSAFAMPPFGWRLSDAEVADVLSFVRASWGNRSPPVNPEQVSRIRRSIAVE